MANLNVYVCLDSSPQLFLDKVASLTLFNFAYPDLAVLMLIVLSLLWENSVNVNLD